MTARYVSLVLCFAVLLFTGASCGLLNRTAADGGIYESPDRGETFMQRNFVEQRGDTQITLNFTNISTIAFHPVTANIMYATTLGAGVYKTTDSGAQWKKTGLQSGSFLDFIIDPTTPSTLYTTDGRRIYKSVDAGEKWQTTYIEARTDQSITDLAIDPRESKRIIATTSTGGVLVSEDFGGTWDVQQWITRGIVHIYQHPSDAKRFYLITSDQHLLRTRDGGTTFDDLNEKWKVITPSLTKLYTLTFRDTSPDVLYLGSAYGMLTSIDGGDTWTLQSTLIRPNTVPITHIALHPDDPLVLYFIAGQTLHRSLDGGTEWAVRSVPTSRAITTMVLHPDNPSILFFGTQLIKKK